MDKEKAFTLIVVLFGSTLVLVGLLGPWISFIASWSYRNETIRIYGRTTAEVSPFFIVYSMMIEASSPIEPTRIQRIIPMNVPVGEGVRYFHDAVSLLIGVTCIAGAAVGIIGQYLVRWRISLTGGLLILIAALSFFIILPWNVNQLYLNLKLHWYLTVVGAAIIIAGASLQSMRNLVRNLVDIFYHAP